MSARNFTTNRRIDDDFKPATKIRQRKAYLALLEESVVLLGRNFGITNNNTPWRDPAVPLQPLDLGQHMQTPLLWGRFRQYGNRTTSVVVLFPDEQLLWFAEKDQHASAIKPFRRFTRLLPIIRHIPGNRSAAIVWQFLWNPC